jgi:hypothetical protein
MQFPKSDRYLLAGLIFIATPAAASQGTIEAEWRWARQWSNPDAVQDWASASLWQSELSADLSLSQQGLTATTTLDTDSAKLSELYYEHSTSWLDYTLGLRELEWAFAYYQSQLDWLDDKRQIMAEYFFSTGSAQTFCRTDDGLCGLRLSGWHDQWDWQLLAGHSKKMQFAGALQRQFGQGGLVYLEGAYQQQAAEFRLEPISDSLWQIRETTADRWQSNIGIQWTTAFELTIQGEWLYRPNTYNRRDWDRITGQLNTTRAASVAQAFQAPLSQHSLLLREYWQIDKIALENVTLYWPQAKHSALNELTIEYELTSVLTISTEWQHTTKQSMLGRIGQGDKISISLNFTDGW